MTNNFSINAYMKNMKGLTLIELIVTLAVIAVLVAIGLPGIQGTSQNSRLTSAINTLSGDLAFARSEAVTRNITVRVRATNGNTDWAGGWVIETVPTVGAPVVIRNSPALKANILLNGSATSLSYISDGTQSGGAVLTFKSCKYGDTSAHGREVRVSTTGRIQLVKDQACP